MALSVLALAVLQHAACLPLDDLSSYSSAWERQADVPAPAEALDAATPDAELDDGGASGAALDASVPPSPTPDAGDGGAERDAGAGPALADGGSELDAAAPAPDAALAP